MPFVPFKKADPHATPAPSPFSKTPAKRRSGRKTGKVAPAQKALMNPGGRSMGGGGR